MISPWACLAHLNSCGTELQRPSTPISTPFTYLFSQYLSMFCVSMKSWNAQQVVSCQMFLCRQLHHRYSSIFLLRGHTHNRVNLTKTIWCINTHKNTISNFTALHLFHIRILGFLLQVFSLVDLNFDHMLACLSACALNWWWIYSSYTYINNDIRWTTSCENSGELCFTKKSASGI